MSPAESPSAEWRAEEVAAGRRGAVRKYFYNSPRVMDVVVVIVYLLAGSSTVVTAAPSDTNLSVYAVIVLSTGVVLMFRRDKPLAVLVVVSIFELLNIIVVSSSGNVGISVWFALYAVAIRYRPLLSFPVAVASTTRLALYTLAFYQFPNEYLIPEGHTATQTKVISAIMMLSCVNGPSVMRSLPQ